MDTSVILYQKYFKLVNRQVVVTLKTGEVLQGQLVGFYKGDVEWDEPYVRAWHCTPTAGLHGLGVDDAGDLLGKVVEQAAIASIYFNEDETTLYF